MRILIVGGLGYIGGRLAIYLKSSNPSFDVHLTSRKNTVPKWAEDFSVHSMDLTNENTVHECISNVRPDTIIHLGGLPQEICREDSEAAYEVNVKGTQRLLDHARQNQVLSFIFMSTFQVYGQLVADISELTPTNALHDYPRTKVEAEKIAELFKSDMNVKILRLSNAFGYPQDIDVASTVWGLVFNAFARDALANQEISPKSHVYRDFISLTDVCRAIEFVMCNTRGLKELVYNLGGDQCYSIVEVAQKVKEVYEEIYQKDIKINLPPEDDQVKFTYNVNRLKEAGFTYLSNEKEEIAKTFKQIELKLGSK